MADHVLLKDREKLFDDVINFRNTKSIPTVANIWTWKFLDNGYKLGDVLYDYDKIIKSMDDFHDRYHFDAYCDLGTRNIMKIADALGGGNHQINDEKDAVEVIQHDRKLMEADEYKELAADPFGFYWSKAMKRLCRDGITVAEMGKAVEEFLAFGDLTDTLKSNLFNNHHAMMLGKAEPMLPFDMLFNNLRGIRNLSLDARKRKEEVIAACDTIFALENEPMLDASMADEYSGYVCPVMIGILGHSILSTKQFGDFYWPYLKKYIDKAIEHNQPLYLVSESSIMRFAEYFQDVPKGLLVIHPEQDDIVELRKKLPNVALAGGIPTTMLGHGTPEQCVDEAKRLADQLGNGFIISQDKMISFPNDAKRENLLAINEYARNAY